MALTKITLTNIDNTGDYSELVDSAFAAANVSDQRAVTSGVYANSAYAAANSASVYANAAYLHANAAFNVANTNSAVAQSGAEKTTSYTLAITDVGKFISVGSGGSIIIPNSVFAAGDAITIFNNTASGVTVTCSIATAYITGFDIDKASVTLTTRGVATILFITSTVCVMAGSVT